MTDAEAKRGGCTVLVCSCDAYSDVESPFIALWRKFWPDCPFDTVLLTETDKGADAAGGEAAGGFDRVIATGRGKSWCAMLAEALDAIATPYVLMVMNDYLLSAPVDTANVLRRLADAQRFDAASLRLNPNPPGRSAVAGTDLLEMPKGVAYCVTCQTSIWNRGFLRGLAARCGSAWEFERRGSFMVADEPRPLLVAPSKEFPFIDALHKGYWERAGLALCREHGVAVDLAARSLPPPTARLKEAAKAAIFRLSPKTLLVKTQNWLEAR